MKKNIITTHQLWSLVVILTCGTTILVVSATLSSFSKQDSWITIIVTCIFGLFNMWLNAYIGSLYPDKTYVEVIREVFGKWIGTIINISFLYFCLVCLSQVISYINSFMSKQYLSNTPVYAIGILAISVLAIALLYGIEVIGRAAEIFVFYISFMFLIAMVLVAPNADVNNLLPILEEGAVPVFKGAVQLSSYITWPIILMNMIYPANVVNIKEAKKSIYKGYLWASLLIFISNILGILVLGVNIASKVTYPTYMLAKEINIGMILTRMEGVLASVWIISIFFRGLMYFYSLTIGLTQIIGLFDYRITVLPIGLIILMLSNIVYPNYAYEVKYDSTTWVLHSFTYGAVLPMLLLIITLIKKRIKKEVNLN